MSHRSSTESRRTGRDPGPAGFQPLAVQPLLGRGGFGRVEGRERLHLQPPSTLYLGGGASRRAIETSRPPGVQESFRGKSTKLTYKLIRKVRSLRISYNRVIAIESVRGGACYRGAHPDDKSGGKQPRLVTHLTFANSLTTTAAELPSVL